MADVTVEGQARRWTEMVSTLQGAPITEYKPFSDRLPGALTGIGGALTILGALGVWIRATVSGVSGSFQAPEEVQRIMGHADTIGWGLAAFGLLALAGSRAWSFRKFLPKLIPITSALVIAGVVARQLLLLQDRYKGMVSKAVDTAKTQAEAGIYHAGYGWGAWILIAASLLLVLGAFAGLMRELDVRRERKRAFAS